MTNRGRNANAFRVEADIERCREESNWKKVIELADQLKARTPDFECLSNFLIGEGKLESYLDEYPPIESNFARAKAGLAEAKRFLEFAANDTGRKAGVFLDAHLLLGKLNYACGLYAESLENYVAAELHKLHEKELPLRSLHIIAESFAIRGLCLEKQGVQGGSRFKQAEQEAEMLHSFELAADLGLSYLQLSDASASANLVPYNSIMSLPVPAPAPSPPPPKGVGLPLRSALQRAPIMYIKHGDLTKAIERYRSMLTALESVSTQSLRLTLARQLAEVLLRGVSGSAYRAPNKQTTKVLNEGPWKPKRHIGQNQFAPKNENEEAILLLLISEALSVRDAVLSQSPEFREVRIHALGNATAIYDLLTIATVRWGQSGLLHDSFERAIKFSFCEAHVWKQYSFTLGVLGRYSQSISSLKIAINLDPTDPTPCLLAARLCYEEMQQIPEGLEFSRMAVSRATNAGLTRALIYEGIGLQLLANTAHIKKQKIQLHKQALSAFEKGVQNDPNDHLAAYYLALECALLGQISDAMYHVKISLELYAENCPGLHLFGLLLTATECHEEALQVLKLAASEFPENLSLMYAKAHLELYLGGGESALETAQSMLMLWRDLYDEQTQEIPEDRRKSDCRSMLQMYTSQFSDRDSASLAASKHALSDEATSSLSIMCPRPGPQRVWLMQLKIWLLMAEVYIALDQPEAAISCVQEAATIFPYSYQIMYLQGMVQMNNNNFEAARQCFANAVAINPLHSDSQQQLGHTQHLLGANRLAEKTLREAARIEPKNPHTWYCLGRVLEALGEFSGASDCMATALEVEVSCPVVPFTSIVPYWE